MRGSASSRIRVAGCGLRIAIVNLQSAIRNPQLRFGVLLICALAMVCTTHEVAAQSSSSLLEVFEEAAAALGAVRQPAVEAADDASADASNDPPLGSEVLPPPRFQGKLPLAGDTTGDVELSESKDGRITLVVRDASLSRVLALLAQTQQLNIVASNDIDALISITLRDVPLEEALTAILSVANYTWVKQNNIILITSLTDAGNLPAGVQGRQIQVFDLDFASATVVAESVTGFLSPIGKVTVSESNPTDNRLTRELVVVEDLPQSLARIADYIAQVDIPPRQVLIEAHVLQVNLDDTCKCGVNLDAIVRLSSSDLTLKTTGFAVPAAPQAFLATLKGGDLGGVIEALQTTTDVKSLGSPKILVLNQQTARMNVGKTIGVQSSVQTDAGITQNAGAEEVGVILELTPRITCDGRVLLNVKPEVSDGAFNPESQAVDTTVTKLETDVMLSDGQGMIIGGLIKETDSVTQSKLPYLGDVKGVGFFFRRSVVTKERQEIIFALVLRIQPYDCEWAAFERGELVKAGVPLFHGSLHRTDRPWDPVLPDGKRVYKPLIPKKRGHGRTGHYYDLGPQYEVPPYPLPKQNFYAAPCDPPGAESSDSPLREAFLSDEPLPVPALSDSTPEESEIITDQNKRGR